jgi:hypothetical protein
MEINIGMGNRRWGEKKKEKHTKTYTSHMLRLGEMLAAYHPFTTSNPTKAL